MEKVGLFGRILLKLGICCHRDRQRLYQEHGDRIHVSAMRCVRCGKRLEFVSKKSG